jgi:hypothetical protein
MKRGTASILVLLLFICACSVATSSARDDEKRAKQYSQVEIMLSDFSKKITGYYAGRNQPIPQDFDSNKFIAILEQIYLNKDKVKLVKSSYKISVRHVDNGYSVMLCDPDTDNKLMEDIASTDCSLSKVEIRFWDKKGAQSCTFEDNWPRYCK